MKLKSVAALGVAGLLTAACLLEGVTAGAVLGYIATNAPRAGATAATIKTAIQSYRDSDSTSQKVRVLADVSCYFRTNYPGEMTYLRSRLHEAGVKQKLIDKAKDLADTKCGREDTPKETPS